MYAEEKEITPASPAQRYKDALTVMRDLEKNYPFFDLKGIRKDWNYSKKVWAKKAKLLKTDVELIKLIQEYIFCLRDAHMSFSEVNIKMPEYEYDYCAGLYFGKLGKNRVVIVNDASKDYAGATAGTEVVSIDGKYARPWLDMQAKTLWAKGGGFSSPQRAECFVYRWGLMGKENEKHKVVILAGGKTKKTITAYNKYKCGIIPPTMPYISDTTQTKKTGKVAYKMLDEKVGYMYIRGLSNDTKPAVAEAIAAMPDAKGMVVNLADNGGGGYNGVADFSKFRGKLAVLISPRTISAGETYARDLVQDFGAKLFGTKTGGSSSSKEEYVLPRNLGKIRYSVRSRSGIKKIIEFNGIEPDFIVEFDQADLKAGVSTLLKTAHTWVLRQIK